jgi:tryptophan synthase alpha subunit
MSLTHRCLNGREFARRTGAHPYVTAGYPSMERSLDLIDEAAAGRSRRH